MESNKGVKTLSLASHHEWKIDKGIVNEMVEPIYSSEFYCPLCDGEYFVCQLILRKIEDGEVISFLKLISCSDHENILIRFTISCSGSERKIDRIVVNPGDEIESIELLSFAQHLRPFVNFVVVKCFVELLAVDVDPVEQYDKNYRSDMEELLNSKKFSDFTLSVQGENIEVHKFILAAKSSFFAEMFGRRMDIFDITDFEYDVIEEMVRFIYTGTSPRCHLMTEQLLKVAADYQVLGLTKLCGNNLLNDLCVENAADTLAIAYRCNVEKIKNDVNDFVCRNFAGVKATSGWKNLLENHDIMDDLLSKLGEFY